MRSKAKSFSWRNRLTMARAAPNHGNWTRTPRRDYLGAGRDERNEMNTMRRRRAGGIAVLALCAGAVGALALPASGLGAVKALEDDRLVGEPIDEIGKRVGMVRSAGAKSSSVDIFWGEVAPSRPGGSRYNSRLARNPNWQGYNWERVDEIIYQMRAKRLTKPVVHIWRSSSADPAGYEPAPTVQSERPDEGSLLRRLPVRRGQAVRRANPGAPRRPAELPLQGRLLGDLERGEPEVLLPQGLEEQREGLRHARHARPAAARPLVRDDGPGGGVARRGTRGRP